MLVGVDIGGDGLGFARVRCAGKRRCELIDCSYVPYDPGNQPGTHGFAGFFKTAFHEFCRSPRGASVWVTSESMRSIVRHILIPKVPRKQIANAAYWSFKRENPIDDDSMTFDFEEEGEVTEDGVPKIATTVYAVDNKEVADLRRLVGQTGCKLAGITVPFFALRNMFHAKWVSVGEDPIVFLYVGRDYSRITVFSRGKILLTRGVKAGVTTLTGAIRDGFRGTLTMEEARNKLSALTPEDVEAGTSLREGEENVFRMVQPALTRLIGQVERTLRSHLGGAHQGKVDRVYLAGAITTCPPLVAYVGQQMQVDMEAIDPFNPNCLSQRVPVPENPIQRYVLTPAIGLALSDNSRTPNLLYTYRDKESAARVRHNDNAVCAGFFVLLAGCIGVAVWQHLAAAVARTGIGTKQHELAQYEEGLTRAGVDALTQRTTQRLHEMKWASREYLGMAVVGEFADLAPENVKLLDAKVGLGGFTTDDRGSGQATDDKLSVSLEGLISGEPQRLESYLAEYVIRLERSTIFTGLQVKKAERKPQADATVLFFRLEMVIVKPDDELPAEAGTTPAATPADE